MGGTIPYAPREQIQMESLPEINPTYAPNSLDDESITT